MNQNLENQLEELRIALKQHEEVSIERIEEIRDLKEQLKKARYTTFMECAQMVRGRLAPAWEFETAFMKRAKSGV